MSLIRRASGRAAKGIDDLYWLAADSSVDPNLGFFAKVRRASAVTPFAVSFNYWDKTWAVHNDTLSQGTTVLVEGPAATLEAAKAAALEALNSGAADTARRRLRLAKVQW